MKKVYTIKVSGSRSSGGELSNAYVHDHYAAEFSTIDKARTAAEEINPKDFISDLLADFRGVSGSISIEVMTWDVDDDGEKELDTWEDVDGCMVTFADGGDGTAMVDGVRTDDENFDWSK